MRIKTMKKVIAMFSMMAVSVSMMGLNVAVAQQTVDTTLTKSTGGGEIPIVKAKWEANSDRYTDDSIAPDAQFLPSGRYQQNKTIAICAVVTDPDGVSDIDAVYADVYYPENIALGDSHVVLNNQSGLGCGKLMQEDTLTKLDPDPGYDLFCNKVRNENTNLPTFNGSTYDYEEICNPDTGELKKLEAAVYCGEKTISYEDPNGDYKVLAAAQDASGLTGTLENYFTYLPMTAFDKDFTTVNYGSVKLNTHKIISGDLDMMTTSVPTVRNVGNTRLSLNVLQDDMGLGMTSGNYNVQYDARVGSDAEFVTYDPNVTTLLNLPLDLSEVNEVDFSVLITKFPPDHTSDSFIGNMTLTATSADHLTCCTSGCNG